MIKGYFFDAHIIGQGPDGSPIYDRAYQAADHADFYKGVFTNGVFLSYDPDALKVSVLGTVLKSLRVAPGRVFADGYQGVADGNDEFPVSALENGYYRLVVRLDKNEDVRAFLIELVRGTDVEYPPVRRDANIYELCISNVIIEDGTPVIEDTRLDPELCGSVQKAGDPAYYPPTELPQLLWTYALFPNTLTAEQKDEVLNNPSLLEIFNNSRAVPTDWRPLEAYETAGTYTWTAPDVYGDGQPYDIGIFIIGAGAGGGVARTLGVTAAAAGGGSGHTKVIIREVLPGDEYPLVVGVKGEGGSTTSTNTSASNSPGVSGENGGSSSFDETAVPGGTGGAALANGSSSTTFVAGAEGGQGSDGSYLGVAAAMGRIPAAGRTGTSTSSVALDMAKSNPAMCYNPFTKQLCLGAGGYAVAGVPLNAGQLAPVLPDGLSAGRGLGNTSTAAQTGYSATSPGSGGGGLAVKVGAQPGTLLKAGSGADGAVYIYVRRPVR